MALISDFGGYSYVTILTGVIFVAPLDDFIAYSSENNENGSEIINETKETSLKVF